MAFQGVSIGHGLGNVTLYGLPPRTGVAVCTSPKLVDKERRRSSVRLAGRTNFA
jgi:hypothetical protein